MESSARAKAVVLALVVVASGVFVACSGSSKPTAGPATTTAGKTTSSAAPAGRSLCAWAVRADKATLNIAYPDTAATYWGLSYHLAAGESLVVQGHYPKARYFSYVTYGPSGGAVATLTDRDVTPDAGSANPFQTPAAAPGGTYTFTLRAGPSGPNVLSAGLIPAVGTTTTTTTAAGAAERVIIGNGGAGAVGGTVLYRVYLPSPASDPTGGAGLASIRLVSASGASTPVPTCAKPGSSAAAVAIVDRFVRPTNAAPAQPIFIRPAGNNANLYPNPDNVYVATIISYRPGRVVVIRAKGPTFPNTTKGQPVTGNEQVRYWSMCTNEYRKPYPVTACSADYQTPLDAQGFYTYVISTPGDRPASTAGTAGSTWLDWGSTKVDGLLIMRNMLASPSFPEAASNLKPGALAISSMGAYAPRGAYCDKAVFEQGGYAACGL